jgi:hypothetical protein
MRSNRRSRSQPVCWIKTAAGRIFPLGLGRQFLAGPSSVGFGVSVRDLHNGMVIETAHRTALTIRATPVGTELETPPVHEIAKIDGMIGWSKRENQA